VVVLDNGAVYSWGVNDEGALGRQTEGPLWEKAEVQGLPFMLVRDRAFAHCCCRHCPSR